METLHERFLRVSALQRESLIVSADDFRVDEHGAYHHEGDFGVIAWRMAENVFTSLLPNVDRVVALVGAPGAGKTTWISQHQKPGVLYLDATLTRRRRRREVCALARQACKEIHCVFVHPDLEVCLAQNRSRGRRVPEEIIRKTHRRLSLCPPAPDEGWATVEDGTA